MQDWFFLVLRKPDLFKLEHFQEGKIYVEKNQIGLAKTSECLDFFENG